MGSSQKALNTGHDGIGSLGTQAVKGKADASGGTQWGGKEASGKATALKVKLYAL